MRRSFLFRKNLTLLSQRQHYYSSLPAAVEPCDPPNVTSPPISEQRLLKAAILGRPNSGKSTLVNQLIGQKIMGVSPKVHTTRQKALGVLTEGCHQVILLDTPGVVHYRVKRKLHLSKAFVTDPLRSAEEANILMIIVDAADKYTRTTLDPSILSIIRDNTHLPLALVLNKVDRVKHKHILLQIVHSLITELSSATNTNSATNSATDDTTKSATDDTTNGTTNSATDDTTNSATDGTTDGTTKKATKKVPKIATDDTTNSATDDTTNSATDDTTNSATDGTTNSATKKATDSATKSATKKAIKRKIKFKEVFMISALTGDGVDKIKDYLLDSTVPSQWEYDCHTLTDQSPEALVEEIIRERLFCHLDQEIPYVIKQTPVIWEKKDDTLKILKNLTCTKDSQVSIVIGPAGNTINTITAEAKEQIEKLLSCPVELELFVNHK